LPLSGEGSALDYASNFGPTEKQAWGAKYQANVKATEWPSSFAGSGNSSINHNVGSVALPYDFMNEFEKMNPEEHRLILDELAERPDLWEDEGVIIYEPGERQQALQQAKRYCANR